MDSPYREATSEGTPASPVVTSYDGWITWKYTKGSRSLRVGAIDDVDVFRNANGIRLEVILRGRKEPILILVTDIDAPGGEEALYGAYEETMRLIREETEKEIAK